MGTVWIAMRTVAWVTLFLGGWYWLSQWLRRFDPAGGAPLPHWTPAIGLPLMIAGGALAAWCIVTFVTRGRGTPSPFDAPRRLVIRGPYRFTRNPMYVGALSLLIGLALVQRSLAVLALAAFALTFVTLFVRLYEEPTLRESFDGEYEAYCRDVPRWLSRLSPRSLPRATGTGPRR